MRKVYKTNYNSLSLQLEYKGMQVKVEFVHGMVSHNIPARLATSDPLLQDIIEADKRFGSLYSLESSQATQDDIEADRIKQSQDTGKEIKKVKNLTDAIDFLSEKGIICTNLEEVNEAAKGLNISFPNMK